MVNDLIERAEHKINKLVSALGEDDEDEITGDAVKAQVKAVSKNRAALVEERDQLSVELSKGQVTDEDREPIQRKARQIREAIIDATFDDKRFVPDALDEAARLREDDTGRWLDVICGIAPERAALCVPIVKSCS